MGKFRNVAGRSGLRAAILSLAAALACSADARNQANVPAQREAWRLVGTWDITLRLERPLSLTTDAHNLPLTVGGTVAFVEDRTGRLSFNQMSRPTNVGVYEIALGTLGFPARDADITPSVVARTLPIPSSATIATGDSVYIMINPETPPHALRMAGMFVGDSITGEWVAESFLGGGGTFSLRRRDNK